MVPDVDRELAVDVLVIGAGLQGAYVARSLQSRYSVCVVSDPEAPPETLDCVGYLSAGYDGNDVARMQPARRAAAYWRLWAESHGVAHGYSPALYAVPPEERQSRSRLWDDAALTYRDASIPAAFVGGSLGGSAFYGLDHDLVVHPAALLHRVTAGIDARFLEGRVARFAMAGSAIDHVMVERGDRAVPVVPRFVVLAAGAGNANLLGMVCKRLADPVARRDRQELARASQAVQDCLVVALRAPDLPLLSGWYGGCCIVAHPAADGDGVVWLVTAPIEGSRSVLGGVESRSAPATDPDAVVDLVVRLLEMCPGLRTPRPELRWAAYTARRTQHPAVAGDDPATMGRPVPAKLDTFGLDGLLALWPSHLGYSMILGDLVAERVGEALGPRADQPARVGLGERRPVPPARWERPDFVWHRWAAFSERFGLRG